MSSRALAIVDAAVAALSAVGKPVGSTVRRQRSTAPKPSLCPFFGVYIVRSTGVAQSASNRVTRRLSIAIGCAAVVADGQDADEAVDPLVVWAWQQLAADLTLGGTCTLVDMDEAEIEYLTAEENEKLALAVLRVPIVFEHAFTDPEAVG